MKQPSHKNSVPDLVSLGLVIAGFALSALAYGRLPDPVPTHWNLHGVVDGWTAKPFGPFVLPLAMLGAWIVLRFVPRISPKGFQVEGFRPAFEVMKVTILGVLLVITAAVHLAGMGHPVSVGRVAQGAVGVLFVVLGNYMGKVTRNFFVGIRTPWTLANEEVWSRTHRFGGRLMVLAGLVCLVAALLDVMSAAILIGAILLAAVVPVAYSYVVYRRLSPKDQGGAGPFRG